MDELKIAGYRVQAEACFAHAGRTHDIPTQRYWLQLADAWTRMADNLAKPGLQKNNDT